MNAIGQFVSNMASLLDRTVAGGYVLALALVCLTQYAYHIYRVLRSQKQSERFRREMDGMEEELRHVNKERSLSRLENRILHEFVSETELERAFELLLRHFVRSADTGFGAFVESSGGGIIVKTSRGLSDDSRENLTIDPQVLDRVKREQFVELNGSPLATSRLRAHLSADDRSKADVLYLISIRSDEDASFLLLTTTLYPPGVSLDQQRELAQRLMASVSGNLERARKLEEQGDQLRVTSEMLELRTILDRQFESPQEMLRVFVSRLAEKLGADRIALYLSTPDGKCSDRPLIRHGKSQQTGVETRCQEFEDDLAARYISGNRMVSLDRPGLEQIGIDTLFGMALVSPLVSEQSGKIGILCATRGRSDVFSENERELAGWASEYLSEALLQVLNRAAIDRRSRQDGLTELANRREFDQRIREELELAQQTLSECSLLLVDLDHFKSINDSYGHLAGDEVLRITARLLRREVSTIRSSDRALIARFGGEEMAVLLPGIGTEGAKRIGESICSAIENEEIVYQSHQLSVTTSLGIATFPEHCGNVEELIAATDAALYLAKESGRNQVRVVCKALLEARTSLPANC